MHGNLPSCQIFASSSRSLRSLTIKAMNGLVIYINWEYFLGVIGTLIGISYYANGRLTRLETSVEWLKEILRGLKINSENGAPRLFDASSPISLTRAGLGILKRSGLKSYIDAHREELVGRCHAKTLSDPYKLQSCAFRLFADLAFDESFAQHLNEFAFANGMSADLLRRVGAIYFRDLAAGAR